MTAKAAQAQAEHAAAAARHAAGVETFELTDSNGEAHAYLVTLHPVDEGQRILWALVALGGEPIGALMQGALGKMIAEGGTLGDLLDAGADEAVARVDWSAVGRDLANAVRQTDMGALAKQILKHTTRDGQALANPAVFNAAYRANYSEYFRALWAVLQANRFLPF
jgi:hypothetical protein